MVVVGREFYLSFCLGCSIGVLFTVIFQEINNNGCFTKIHNRFRTETGMNREDENYLRLEKNDPNHPSIPLFTNKSHGPIVFNDLNTLHHKGGDKVAKLLAVKIRVLCWVMTQPKTLHTKAQAVKDTWGKRCNVLVFMSSITDLSFPVVGLNTPEAMYFFMTTKFALNYQGRDNLWLKTRAAWKYVYDHHYNDADWFLKADDDSYVILENLRYFLSAFNTSMPHYFGRHFTPFGGYNSGGAGYVFSKKALKDFNKIMKDPVRCKLKSFAEDAEVGKCLQAMKIHPGDTRDELGRETFHPLSPAYHLIPGSIPPENWLHQYNKWKVVTGPDCCSDHSIAFHYVPPNKMYELEYLIYHLHPFGIHHVYD